MDPLADKLLVTAALVSLSEMHLISGWIVVVIIAREFAVSGLRTLAASDGIIIAASWWGKLKTVTQMAAIITLLLKVNIGVSQASIDFVSNNHFLNVFFTYAPNILLILAVFLIQNTIKLTIYARKNELKIMKLVGASATHVTVPFLVEGLIIGVLGAIGPILFTVFGYQYLYELFGGVLVIPMFQLTAPLPLVYTLSFGIGIISIAISLIGSFFAVIRYSLKI